MTDPTASTLTLAQYPETLAVVRFGPGTDVPGWAESSSLFGVLATAVETSVVCAARNVPGKARARRPLVGFALVPSDAEDAPALGASVLVELLAPLAEAGHKVEVFSTHDTVWLLVHKNDAEQVAEEWRRRGVRVAPALAV